jgi:hypothetical protein
VNLQKFGALFSTRLSQLGWAVTSFAQDGSKNAHGCIQNAENGIGFSFLEQCHKDEYEFLNTS